MESLEVYSLYVDGKEIAKVPFGGLESVLSCVLKSVPFVVIQFSKFDI